MTIYDPACGSGGMLAESQKHIKNEEGEIKATGDVYLYGKEINDETYAICKSDMMIKGNNHKNIRMGSTLSTDEFSGNNFDFMLSKSTLWKIMEYGFEAIKDRERNYRPSFCHFIKRLLGQCGRRRCYPRSSDGQLLLMKWSIDDLPAKVQ